jgi:hypothetical protein
MTHTISYRQVFIQDGLTRMFLTPQQSWTNSIEKAQDFETSVNAISHVLTHRVHRAQICIHFTNNRQKDITVPVPCGQESAN